MYILLLAFDKGPATRRRQPVRQGRETSMPHLALRAAASPKQIVEKCDTDGLSKARDRIASPAAGADPFGSCRARHFVGEGTNTSN
jgi:hypothetical protein